MLNQVQHDKNIQHDEARLTNMNHTRNFPQQTHFIGVLVPDEIAAKLEECRRYMNEKYGCKSGFKTPIHVTLVPPFRLDERFSTKDLADAILRDVASKPEEFKFAARIENFDAFGDRTVFAKVLQDEKWTKLRDAVLAAVLKAAPGCAKKDKRIFQPHLTVANRDIPAGASKDALEVFNELNLVAEFEVDNITVFERREGKWRAGRMVEMR